MKKRTKSQVNFELQLDRYYENMFLNKWLTRSI